MAVTMTILPVRTSVQSSQSIALNCVVTNSGTSNVTIEGIKPQSLGAAIDFGAISLGPLGSPQIIAGGTYSFSFLAAPMASVLPCSTQVTVTVTLTDGTIVQPAAAVTLNAFPSVNFVPVTPGAYRFDERLNSYMCAL